MFKAIFDKIKFTDEIDVEIQRHLLAFQENQGDYLKTTSSQKVAELRFLQRSLPQKTFGLHLLV